MIYMFTNEQTNLISYLVKERISDIDNLIDGDAIG